METKLQLLRAMVRRHSKGSRLMALERLRKAGIITRNGNISPVYKDGVP